jgi:hypothetical protein
MLQLRNSAKLWKSTIQPFSKPLIFQYFTIGSGIAIRGCVPDVTGIGKAQERLDVEGHEGSERRSGL